MLAVNKRRVRKFRKFRKGMRRQKLSVAINKVINSRAEKKYYITNSGPSPYKVGISTAGYVAQMSGIGQGDTDTSRDGDSLLVKSLNLNYQIEVGDTFNVIRVIMFQWFPTSVPTAGNILQDVTLGVLNPHQTYNHDLRYNYKVLYDKTHTIGATSTNIPIVKISKQVYITSGFKRKLQYQAATTTGNNQFYLMAISDSSAGPDPQLIYNVKLNFLDY